MDSDLSGNTHFSYVAKQTAAFPACYIQRRYFCHCRFEKWLKCLSIRNITLWNYHLWEFSHALAHKKDTILKSILRRVTYTSFGVCSEELFSALCFPRISALLQRCFICKHYWRGPFNTPRAVQRALQESERFVIACVYSKYGKRLRSFYVPQHFNSLPDSFLTLNSMR